MSLILTKDDCRLTVIGKGWNKSETNVGDGWTEEGEIVKGIAEDLKYHVGEDMDWNQIAIDTGFDIDLSDGVYISDNLITTDNLMTYTDLNGVTWLNDTGLIDSGWESLDGQLLEGTPPGLLYTNDGTGTFLDPYGNEYTGLGASMYLPQTEYQGIADKLADMKEDDEPLARYSIPEDTLKDLMYNVVGGPRTEGGTSTIHEYSPPADYYTQRGNSVIFTKGQLTHRLKGGGSFTPVKISFSIHDSGVRVCYMDNCSPLYQEVRGGNISDSLPSIYSSLSSGVSDVRHQYIVWQLCYGSFDLYLITDPTGEAGDLSDIEKVAAIDKATHAVTYWYKLRNRGYYED